MLNLKFFLGKKPDTVPTLAAATERLTLARQGQAQAADELTRAQEALGQALLNATDDLAIAKARKALTAAEVTESESALTLAAAETVHKAAQAAAAIVDREQFDAAAKEQAAKLQRVAVKFDAQLQTQAETGDEWLREAEALRPYLSDEGNDALNRARIVLHSCIGDKLHQFPGFSKHPRLADVFATWAQHMPKADGQDWQRLIRK